MLDRTKEPGCGGEPLYLDCVNALYEQGRGDVRVVGGRYGLSSKEFTPAMVKAVFDNLAQASPKNHFTVGIDDDLSHTSLEVDPDFSIEPDDVVRAQFFGLGADGTVGANKESIKIIGENTGQFRAGLFCLRLEEVRRDHDLASALRTASDQIDLSDHSGELRRPVINRSCSRPSDVLKDLVPGRDVSPQFAV